MININTNKTKNALAEHWKGLEPILKIQISKIENEEIKSFLENKLEDIIESLPEDLLSLNDEYQRILDSARTAKIKKAIERSVSVVMCYKSFITKSKRYDAYVLAENLDIRVCPYCNRQYTITVSRSGKTLRPEFDHFFPKSRYPLLALSFYNLIPCCHVCNSNLKGSINFNLEDYIHPYMSVDNVINGFNFNYELENMNSISKIYIDYNEGEKKDKLKKTLDTFKIEDIYTAHKDIAEDILEIKNKFSDEYLSYLASYKGLNLTKEYMYRLAFGTYLEDTNFCKRPFSKFKKDIAKIVGIL